MGKRYTWTVALDKDFEYQNYLMNRCASTVVEVEALVAIANNMKTFESTIRLKKAIMF